MILVSSFYQWSLFIGILLGLVQLARLAPSGRTAAWLDTGLAVLLGALLGARGVFVAAAWPYFRTHPGDILMVSAGGLAWPGALGGAVLIVLGFAWAGRGNPGLVGDQMLPLALPVVVSLWLGCLGGGCFYGAAAPGSWWALSSPDEWGRSLARLPLQVIGAAACLAVFALVEVLRPRIRRPGQASSLAWFGLSAVLLGLSFLRADPEQVWRGWRLDSLAGLGFTGLSALACAVCFWPRPGKRR
jgi:phosphatidylglycerol:prolipoprotein diacylglycerol transferase